MMCVNYYVMESVKLGSMTIEKFLSRYAEVSYVHWKEKQLLLAGANK